MTSSSHSLSSDHTAVQLERFIAGEREARECLPRLAQKQLVAMASRLARDLPRDLHVEVVAEVWTLLILRRPPFDRRLGTARAFFRTVMKSAVRSVRATYAAAGTAKRAAANMAPAPLLSTVDGEEGAFVPTDSGAGARMEAHVAAEEVLRRAPPQLRIPLRLVNEAEFTITEVARRMSVSRFTLARALTAFAMEVAA